MKHVRLQPHQTITQKRAEERLERDAANIHQVIRTHPGISGCRAIAEKTGLSPQRIRGVIKRMKNGETGHIRVDHGEGTPTGGPFAGQTVRGWFVMDNRQHHPVMDSADEHSSKIELGVRRSRLLRILQAHGIVGAGKIVKSMEERLGVDVETMAETELEAFLDLVLEEVPNGA